jgi:hypothetical protein
VDDDDDVDEEEDEGTAKKSNKPDASRVILEVKPLIDAIKNHARCNTFCYGRMMASMNNLCIATNMVFACNDSKFGYVFHSKAPVAAGLGNKNLDNRTRSNDFAINVLYVLFVIYTIQASGLCDVRRLIDFRKGLLL